ncbi:MAG: Repressor homolog, partial [uncultured Acetobacteraceae bacterium]
EVCRHRTAVARLPPRVGPPRRGDRGEAGCVPGGAVPLREGRGHQARHGPAAGRVAEDLSVVVARDRRRILRPAGRLPGAAPADRGASRADHPVRQRPVFPDLHRRLRRRGGGGLDGGGGRAPRPVRGTRGGGAVPRSPGRATAGAPAAPPQCAGDLVRGVHPALPRRGRGWRAGHAGAGPHPLPRRGAVGGRGHGRADGVGADRRADRPCGGAGPDGQLHGVARARPGQRDRGPFRCGCRSLRGGRRRQHHRRRRRHRRPPARRRSRVARCVEGRRRCGAGARLGGGGPALRV